MMRNLCLKKVTCVIYHYSICTNVTANVIEWNSVDMDQVWFVATVQEAEIHEEAIMAQMDEYCLSKLVH